MSSSKMVEVPAAGKENDGDRRSEVEDGDQASSEESSSIGNPDDDSDEVGSSGRSTLSLASLEDSLPIKRGLSKHYGGKSKSFCNLAEVKSVTELAKSDNPFNKRRRTLLAYKLNKATSPSSSTASSNETSLRMMMKKKKSAFYSHSSHISMPLLPLAEHHAAAMVDESESESCEYTPPLNTDH